MSENQKDMFAATVKVPVNYVYHLIADGEVVRSVDADWAVANYAALRSSGTCALVGTNAAMAWLREQLEPAPAVPLVMPSRPTTVQLEQESRDGGGESSDSSSESDEEEVAASASLFSQAKRAFAKTQFRADKPTRTSPATDVRKALNKLKSSTLRVGLAQATLAMPLLAFVFVSLPAALATTAILATAVAVTDDASTSELPDNATWSDKVKAFFSRVVRIPGNVYETAQGHGVLQSYLEVVALFFTSLLAVNVPTTHAHLDPWSLLATVVATALLPDELATVFCAMLGVPKFKAEKSNRSWFATACLAVYRFLSDYLVEFPSEFEVVACFSAAYCVKLQSKRWTDAHNVVHGCRAPVLGDQGGYYTAHRITFSRWRHIHYAMLAAVLLYCSSEGAGEITPELKKDKREKQAPSPNQQKAKAAKNSKRVKGRDLRAKKYQHYDNGELEESPLVIEDDDDKAMHQQQQQQDDAEDDDEYQYNDVDYGRGGGDLQPDGLFTVESYFRRLRGWYATAKRRLGYADATPQGGEDRVPVIKVGPSASAGDEAKKASSTVTPQPVAAAPANITSSAVVAPEALMPNSQAPTGAMVVGLFNFPVDGGVARTVATKVTAVVKGRQVTGLLVAPDAFGDRTDKRTYMDLAEAAVAAGTEFTFALPDKTKTTTAKISAVYAFAAEGAGLNDCPFLIECAVPTPKGQFVASVPATAAIREGMIKNALTFFRPSSANANFSIGVLGSIVGHLTGTTYLCYSFSTTKGDCGTPGFSGNTVCVVHAGAYTAETIRRNVGVPVDSEMLCSIADARKRLGVKLQQLEFKPQNVVFPGEPPSPEAFAIWRDATIADVNADSLAYKTASVSTSVRDLGDRFDCPAPFGLTTARRGKTSEVFGPSVSGPMQVAPATYEVLVNELAGRTKGLGDDHGLDAIMAVEAQRLFATVPPGFRRFDLSSTSPAVRRYAWAYGLAATATQSFATGWERRFSISLAPKQRPTRDVLWQAALRDEGLLEKMVRYVDSVFSALSAVTLLNMPVWWFEKSEPIPRKKVDANRSRIVSTPDWAVHVITWVLTTFFEPGTTPESLWKRGAVFYTLDEVMGLNRRTISPEFTFGFGGAMLSELRDLSFAVDGRTVVDVDVEAWDRSIHASWYMSMYKHLFPPQHSRLALNMCASVNRYAALVGAHGIFQSTDWSWKSGQYTTLSGNSFIHHCLLKKFGWDGIVCGDDANIFDVPADVVRQCYKSVGLVTKECEETDGLSFCKIGATRGVINLKLDKLVHKMLLRARIYLAPLHQYFAAHQGDVSIEILKLMTKLDEMRVF